MTVTDMESTGRGDGRAKGKGRRKLAAAIAGAVVLIAAGVVFALFLRGDLAPADAAAKYDGFTYLAESDVNDYVQLYREQMRLDDAGDELWAQFLASSNLTPARLRYSTIRQIITDRLVRKKARQLGLEASDEEVSASLDTLKDTMSLGSDEIWKETLEARGQTEEGLHDVYQLAILKRKVLTAEVPMPSASDEEVKAYLKQHVADLRSTTLKHTYCFKLTDDDEGGSRKTLLRVQELRNSFERNGMNADAFAEMVKANSDDSTLVGSQGANGWDIDSGEYSEGYLEVLSQLGEGGLSHVFVDDGSYTFIWVNDVYELPTQDSAIDELDLSLVPVSLVNYLRDSAAYAQWEDDGKGYMAKLLDDAGIVYYPMPADVPYNVDMSLAGGSQAEDGDDGSQASGTDGSQEAGAGEPTG